MTQQEILEYNRRCAEFRGGVFHKEPHATHSFHTMPKGLPKEEYEKGKKEGFYTEGQLKYDSDWNWIMEVIQNIGTVSEEINSKHETESEYYQQFYALRIHKFYICHAQKEREIHAINEFLIWYNEN